MILKIEKISKTNHKGADIIKKKTLAKFNLFFFLAVSLSFGIYAYTVSENWLIDFQEQKYNLLFFCLLFLCCLGVAVIDGTAGRYEGERVSGKAVLAGIRIVAVFMLLMAAGVILRML